MSKTGGNQVKLKPCPFCGSHDVSLVCVDEALGAWMVKCNKVACWGRTADFLTMRSAEIAWNRRNGKYDKKTQDEIFARLRKVAQHE